MRKPFVLTFAAAAALAACSRESSTAPSASTGTALESALPPRSLPSWDGVPSPRPRGLNPPAPVLIVDPKGTCFKKWEGAGTDPGPDRVEDCAGKEAACGTMIQCPQPRAQSALDGDRARRR